MKISLKVETYCGQSLAQQFEKSFGESGGTLGRAVGNDMVLEDPGKYISRIHARVEFFEGSYYLLDIGSNPSLVNDKPLGAGRRVRLDSGDRLNIGEYKISVSIHSGASVIAPEPLADPSLKVESISASILPLPDESDSLASAKILDVGGDLNLAGFDPLGVNLFANSGNDFFAPPSQEGGVPAFRGTEGDHVSPEIQPFPSAQSAALPTMAIPDDYDPLADYLPPRVTAAPATSSIALSAAMPESQPEFFGGLASNEGPRATQAVQSDSAPGALLVSTEQVGAVKNDVFTGLAVAKSLEPVVNEVFSDSVPEPATAAPASGADAGEAALMQALLRGLGLPELKSNRSPQEIAELVGAMLREATSGTIGVLMARTITKRESRLEMTMISAQANNPLKFFPNADSALSQMLNGPMAGYMSPVRAYSNAFDDLKAHELAMMAGMRAALSGVLERFNPEVIEQRLQVPSVMDKVLATSRKAKMWDKLVELYKDISDEADDDFQRLFGEKFSDAYEEQVERLRNNQK